MYVMWTYTPENGKGWVPMHNGRAYHFAYCAFTINCAIEEDPDCLFAILPKEMRPV